MSLILRDDIVTPRLTLIAITPEMLMSEKNGDGRLGELIQCAVPANWPPEHWEPHVFDFILAQFAEHPEQIGWHYYVCLVPADGRRSLIGALGASSKTATPLECEIGYSILPPHERQGFATEGTNRERDCAHVSVTAGIDPGDRWRKFSATVSCQGRRRLPLRSSLCAPGFFGPADR
jgi:hypothetical protein